MNDTGTKTEKMRLRKEFNKGLAHRDETILLEIPAYKDPELIPTMQSALIQADVPSRIHFAVCLQDDDISRLEQVKTFRNASYEHVLPQNAKGSCYARHICDRMLNGEDFILRIDSHMRFIKHWDTELIKQWYAIGDPKAVISSYARTWKPEYYDKRYDDAVFSEPLSGTKICAKEILNRDAFKIRFLSIKVPEKSFFVDFCRSAFIAGHFQFAASSYGRDVPYDPDMYFTTDEWPYNIRVFTCGYNVYAPKTHYVLHKCKRSEVGERAFPSNPDSKDAKKREAARALALLGLNRDIDLGPYGLGTERSLSEFEDFAGMDIKNRVLLPKAMSMKFE